MSEWLLLDGARRLLGDACTYEAVQAAESDGWSSAIWDAVADAGYARCRSWHRRCARVGERRRSTPVPLRTALAGWLVGERRRAGQRRGRRGPGARAGPAQRSAVRVPWGRAVERIVAVVGGQAMVVAVVGGERRNRTNLAGELRDTLRVRRAEVDDARPPRATCASAGP
jgi:hypothetical protein